MVGSGGDGVADGRAVLAGHVHLDELQVLKQRRVVQRQRALQDGPRAEDDDADAVVQASLDKGLGVKLGRLDAV